jgi:putative membrane protein
MLCHAGLGLGGLVVGVIGFFLLIMFIMMVARLAMGRRMYWMHGYGVHRYGMAGTDPLEIAKERYARGEINKEQFEQIKKDIA